MIIHITVEDAAKLISRLTNANETQALTYIREAADRGEIHAADVAPVRHGYWEFPIFTDNDDGLDPRVKCSECGSVEAAFARWKYCPNCGARMDKLGGDDPGPKGVPGPPGEVVFCKDCDYLEYSDCYGECGRGYLGIVKPYDYCSRGMWREKENDI